MLSLGIPLADPVVDPIPSLVNPTLLLKSEVEVVDLILTSVDPTLPLKSEVKVVDPILTSVDPTLLLKSEVEVVNPSPSLVDPTLSLESEVKVVESMSTPPNPTLLLESVETAVVLLTQSSSCPSYPINSENHSVEVFVVSSDCSMQEEILSLLTEPSLSSEVISFDWSNLTKYRIPSSVHF